MRRIRAFLREALRDNQTDFTTGPINRGLGLLAIPMMLEMSMEAVFAVVDIAFVSRLGTNAVAAVGLTEALVTVLYAVAIGLGMGVTAMVSRRIGARDPLAAAYVVGQAIWVGAVLAAVIGVAGALLAESSYRHQLEADIQPFEGIKQGFSRRHAARQSQDHRVSRIRVEKQGDVRRQGLRGPVAVRGCVGLAAVEP